MEHTAATHPKADANVRCEALRGLALLRQGLAAMVREPEQRAAAVAVYAGVLPGLGPFGGQPLLGALRRPPRRLLRVPLRKSPRTPRRCFCRAPEGHRAGSGDSGDGGGESNGNGSGGSAGDELGVVAGRGVRAAAAAGAGAAAAGVDVSAEDAAGKEEEVD